MLKRLILKAKYREGHRNCFPDFSFSFRAISLIKVGYDKSPSSTKSFVSTAAVRTCLFSVPGPLVRAVCFLCETAAIIAKTL